MRTEKSVGVYGVAVPSPWYPGQQSGTDTHWVSESALLQLLEIVLAFPSSWLFITLCLSGCARVPSFRISLTKTNNFSVVPCRSAGCASIDPLERDK